MACSSSFIVQRSSYTYTNIRRNHSTGFIWPEALHNHDQKRDINQIHNLINQNVFKVVSLFHLYVDFFLLSCKLRWAADLYSREVSAVAVIQPYVVRVLSAWTCSHFVFFLLLMFKLQSFSELNSSTKCSLLIFFYAAVVCHLFRLDVLFIISLLYCHHT